jgi:hypothetical protein
LDIEKINKNCNQKKIKTGKNIDIYGRGRGGGRIG